MVPNYFEYGGTKMAWTRLGSGKPLVFLHGWGSSSAVMQPLAQGLQTIRACYLIDFPGFGASPEPPDAWTVDEYANMIQAFIEQTFPDKSVDFLVHSYGARVLLKLLTRPAISPKIDKVLITGGAGLKPKRKLTFYIKKYAARFLKAPFTILPQAWRNPALDRMRQTALWKKLGSSDYQKLSGVMREIFVKSVTEHLDDLLPKIEHEVLLIWGENDTATPMDQARRMEKGLKNGVLITIGDAAHYVFLDKPANFAAIAKSYLKS